ncbi:hypothetical protein KEJ49_04610 [Candidatus Bathyarchaeota archaeon]|nr:hypothetical protein [Candidatus Bathyarchaeota archaeon]
MMMSEPPGPRYREALSRDNARRAAIALSRLGGVAKFSEIERASGVRGSTLLHNLNILIQFGLVERLVKGTYGLRYLTPLCYIFSDKPLPIAYMGLLGRREGREKPETETALELLRAENIKPETIHVLTTHEAFDDWKEMRLQYDWILCYEDEIYDIDSVREKVKRRWELLSKKYMLILDCTSATKPATIAYYEIAQTYQIPLIYIYEPTLKLKWLKSKETIKKEIIANR